MFKAMPKAQVTVCNVRFNRIFKEANEFTGRYKVLLGSAGSGKSVNTAQDYVMKLSDARYTGANLLVVRSSENSHMNSTFAELLGAINRANLSHLWNVRLAPMTLTCKSTGNSILFRGCNDVRALERLKSVTVERGKLTWIWVEEATELASSDFEVLDERLRGELDNQDLFYQITLTFNPIDAQHWIKKNLWDIENPEVFKLKSTYLDNAFIDEAYKERMQRRKVLDPDGYTVYGLGEWGSTQDNILSNYVLAPCDQNLENYDAVTCGQDFGFNHANALLLLGYRDGVIFVLRESYHHEKHTGELISHAKGEMWPTQYIIYCDSANPDKIKEWKQAGFRALPVKKNPGSVRAQIDYLKKHRIQVDPQCENTFKEMQQWRWRKDSSGNVLDSPLEVYDDAMAALRYGIEPFRRETRMRTMSKLSLGIR